MEEVSEYFGAPLGVKYMPASKAQQKAVNKYVKANYDLYQIKMPKGKKDDIKVAAAAACESVNAYINTAIAQRMERDGAGGPQEAVGTLMGDRVSLPSDTLKAAQEAAQATGEDLPMYIARVVSEVAERDRLSHRAEGGKVNE